MINKLIEIFGLKEYENIRKIQKNIFYKEDNFSKSYEKLFTKDVDSIYIISALNKNSINISNYKTEEYNYSELYYLYVSLKSDKNISEINKIIHSIIPNPCIIILGYSDSIIISTATKRISKNDKTKQVIEDYFITDKIDLDYQTDIEKEFLKDITLISNSFENFKRFYTDISNKILIIKTSNLRGGYKRTNLENIGKLLEYYNNLKKLNNELLTINSEYKNEISMGEKAIIYGKIVRKEKEINAIKYEIKNI